MKENGPYNIWVEAETVIEFFHCDPMGVVWHGNYFSFFEIARRMLFEKIRYDYNEMEKSGYAFPIIEAYAKYLDSLKFKDRVRIKAVLLEYENRIKIEFKIFNMETGKLSCKGTSTQMAYDVTKGESCFYCPKVWIDKVESLLEKGTS